MKIVWRLLLGFGGVFQLVFALAVMFFDFNVKAAVPAWQANLIIGPMIAVTMAGICCAFFFRSRASEERRRALQMPVVVTLTIIGVHLLMEKAPSFGFEVTSLLLLLTGMWCIATAVWHDWDYQPETDEAPTPERARPM